jgi:ankyrin repeat protein
MMWQNCCASMAAAKGFEGVAGRLAPLVRLRSLYNRLVMPAPKSMKRFSNPLVAFVTIGAIMGVFPAVQRAGASEKTAEEQFWNAASKGDVSQLEQILNQGVKVDAADKIGRTALIFAAINGRVEAMKFLMAKNTSVLS